MRYARCCAVTWTVAVLCSAQGIWDSALSARKEGRIIDVSDVARVAVDDVEAITGEWEKRPDAGSKGGTLLCAATGQVCPDAAVPLNVRGWHAIYIGFLRPGGQTRFGGSGVAVRLSRDAYRLPLLPSVGRCEVFFKNADLSGQRLIISNILRRPAAVDYVRVVPLDDEQVQEVARAMSMPRTKALAAVCDSNMHYQIYGSARHRDVFDMVASHAAVGFDRLYYIGNTGTLFYQTNVADRYTAGDEIEKNNSALMIKRFPVLRDAVAAGRQAGILVFGWYRMNNEFGSKSSYHPALCSQLLFDRPDLQCVFRNGRRDASKLSYAFKEVRRYRLEIMKEMAAFGVDGLMLGFRRHPPMMRYEKPLIDGYSAKHAVDPRQIDKRKQPDEFRRWLQFRADVMTEFVRELKRELDAMGKGDLPIAVRVRAQGFEQNMEECVDLRTWVEEGLVDEIHAFAGYTLNVAPMDIPGRLQPLVDLCRGTGVKVYGGSQDRTVRNATEMQDAVAFVHATGADGVTVYESEAMVGLPQIRPVFERSRIEQRVARPWLAFSSAADLPAFPWRPDVGDHEPWWQASVDPVPDGSTLSVEFEGHVDARVFAADAAGVLQLLTPKENAPGCFTCLLPVGAERIRVSVPQGTGVALTALRIEHPGTKPFVVGYREVDGIEVADLTNGQVLDGPRHFQVKVGQRLGGSVSTVNFFIDRRLASVEKSPPYFLGGDYYELDVRRLGPGEHKLRLTIGDDVLRSPWQRSYAFAVNVPTSFGKDDLCAALNGAKVVTSAGDPLTDAKVWAPARLIDGSVKAGHPKETCWLCKRTGEVVIRLARKATVRRILASNYYVDTPYTRQAKGVTISLAMDAAGPFTPVWTGTLRQMVNYWETRQVRIKPMQAAFLKVEITSNYGHSGQSVLNFVEAYVE